MIPKTNLNQSFLTSYWSKSIRIHVSPVTGHPAVFTTEDPAGIFRSKAEAEQLSWTNALGGKAGQSNEKIEPPDDVHGYIPKMGGV